MEDNQARDVGASGSAHGQEVRINAKLVWQNPSKDSPLSVRSGHRVDVELNSYSRSNQVDFHLSFVLCFSHICRWMQRLRWPGRTRRSATQRRLKLRYQKLQMSTIPFWYPTNNCVFQVWCFQWKHLSKQNCEKSVKIEIEDKLWTSLKSWKHRHSPETLKNSLSRQNSSSTFDRAPLMWPRLILPCSSWLQNWYFYTLWIKRYKYKTLPILWYLITQVHQFCFSRLQTSTFIDKAIQKTGTHWFDKKRFFFFHFFIPRSFWSPWHKSKLVLQSRRRYQMTCKTRQITN